MKKSLNGKQKLILWILAVIAVPVVLFPPVNEESMLYSTTFRQFEHVSTKFNGWAFIGDVDFNPVTASSPLPPHKEQTFTQRMYTIGLSKDRQIFAYELFAIELALLFLAGRIGFHFTKTD